MLWKSQSIPAHPYVAALPPCSQIPKSPPPPLFPANHPLPPPSQSPSPGSRSAQAPRFWESGKAFSSGAQILTLGRRNPLGSAPGRGSSFPNPGEEGSVPPPFPSRSHPKNGEGAREAPAPRYSGDGKVSLLAPGREGEGQQEKRENPAGRKSWMRPGPASSRGRGKDREGPGSAPGSRHKRRGTKGGFPVPAPPNPAGIPRAAPAPSPFSQGIPWG